MKTRLETLAATSLNAHCPISRLTLRLQSCWLITSMSMLCSLKAHLLASLLHVTVSWDALSRFYTLCDLGRNELSYDILWHPAAALRMWMRYCSIIVACAAAGICSTRRLSQFRSRRLTLLPCSPSGSQLTKLKLLIIIYVKLLRSWRSSRQLSFPENSLSPWSISTADDSGCITRQYSVRKKNHFLTVQFNPYIGPITLLAV